jgi:hypothetical protein
MDRHVRIASPSPMDCVLLHKETTAKTAGRKIENWESRPDSSRKIRNRPFAESQFRPRSKPIPPLGRCGR